MPETGDLVRGMRVDIARAKRHAGGFLDKLEATDGVLAVGLPYWQGLDERFSGQNPPIVASGIAVLQGLAEQTARLNAEAIILEEHPDELLSATGTYAALVSSVSVSGFQVEGFDPQTVTERADHYADGRNAGQHYIIPPSNGLALRCAGPVSDEYD